MQSLSGHARAAGMAKGGCPAVCTVCGSLIRAYHFMGFGSGDFLPEHGIKKSLSLSACLRVEFTAFVAGFGGYILHSDFLQSSI